MTVVHAGELSTVLPSEILVLDLLAGGPNVLLMLSLQLLRGGVGWNAAVAAVEADVVEGRVVDFNWMFIHVMHDPDVVHRTVVEKSSVAPVATLVADAAVTEAV